jgi:hypothetical protein
VTKAKGTERDISAKDSRWKCSRCGARHRPFTICPPIRTWIVLTFCPDCRPNPYGPALYCKNHKS